MNEPRRAASGIATSPPGFVEGGTPPRSAVSAYLFTAAAIAAATVVRWLLDPWMGDGLPFFTFYFALLFAAWYGGWRPGMAALVLGFLIGVFFFAAPRFNWQIESVINRFDALRFILVGVGTTLICETLHRHRRRAEEREELLRVTLASVGDGVIATDTEGRVTYMNPVAETLTGWTRPDASGAMLETVFHIVNEDTRQPVENPGTRALREGVIVGLANHTVLITKDGTERPIDDSASPIRDKDGRVFGCVLIFRDVTGKRATEVALRRREAELRERHDELQSIYETTPVGMSLVDRDLRFVRVNNRLAEMNGVPAADHIGKTIREIVPDLAKQVEPAFRRVLETGEPIIDAEVTGETPARCGVKRTWVESWYPLRNAANEIVGLNAIVVEITDRKRDEVQIYKLMAELKNADRRKDEFLATLAHELRGPLAPLGNMLQVMKRADGTPELLRRARDTMERQLGQMVRLVDDLLDVGRITRNKLELRMDRVELASVMHQAAETCRSLAEEFGHELVVSPPDEPIHLHADPVRLTQVFSNLLNNACKYTEPHGRIRLSAERAGSEVVVKVSDTGVGIPADKLESVFEMFSQVDRSLERSQGGLGIGLMLVKRLVEMHGGSVEASSDGPGKGSEFTLRLPILAEAPQAAAAIPSSLAAAPASARRILVVDDNEDSATSLAMLLKITGNETHTAHDGLAALDAAETLRPEVILLDIGLPKLNGHDVCRRIRQQPWGKSVVVIAMTGWGQDEDRRKSRDNGFDHHLVKPVDYAALMKFLTAPSRSEIAG
jgi:PAS domain S-box-containing protein